MDSLILQAMGKISNKGITRRQGETPHKKLLRFVL
jgi:hypothetical protein